MHFWQQLPTPFLAVAPMADVTDAAFRRLVAKYSNSGESALARSVSSSQIPSASASASPAARPHPHQSVPDPSGSQRFVTWTEFVAADGLVRATPEGKEKLMADLIYSEAERPIVAQLFSSTPEHMEYAARLCAELGFDGIDINMGCPDRSIEKQGCGAAMIKTPEVAKEIIRAAKRGAGEVPVSVKTRIGYRIDEIDTWIPTLLAEQPAALTVHLRTRQQLSKVPANWELLPRVVAWRDQLSPETKVLGNGDVLSAEDGRRKAQLSGADGVMVGRALFGNPWFFHPTKRLPWQLTALPTHGVDRDTIVTAAEKEEGIEYVTLKERLEVMVEHTKLFCELLPHKNFSVMKKHFKAYVSGFPGAADLRHQLMESHTADEVSHIVVQFLENTEK